MINDGDRDDEEFISWIYVTCVVSNMWEKSRPLMPHRLPQTSEAPWAPEHWSNLLHYQVDWKNDEHNS